MHRSWRAQRGATITSSATKRDGGRDMIAPPRREAILERTHFTITPCARTPGLAAAYEHERAAARRGKSIATVCAPRTRRSWHGPEVERHQGRPGAARVELSPRPGERLDGHRRRPVKARDTEPGAAEEG